MQLRLMENTTRKVFHVPLLKIIITYLSIYLKDFATYIDFSVGFYINLCVRAFVSFSFSVCLYIDLSPYPVCVYVYLILSVPIYLFVYLSR